MSEELAVRHAEHVSAIVKEDTVGALVDANIACSWTRCIDAYGIDPAQYHHTQVIEHQHLLEHQERLESLLDIARFEMGNLHRQIAGSGYVILLTDSDGIILDSVTDGVLIDQFGRAGLWSGSIWSEEYEGTNAIGTCLVEKQPIIVHRDEHFRIRNIHLTCSASPIFDPDHNLLAVLDASSVNCQDSKQSQYHTLALATLSAKLIENCLFLRQFRQSWVLRFHSQPEYVGLMNAGLLAFDEEGHILAANQSAVNQLDRGQHRDLIGRLIGDAFDLRLDNLLGRAHYQPNVVWPVHDRHGHQHFAMLRGPETTPQPDHAPRLVEPARAPLSMSLDGLQGDDPFMVHNVRCAKRIMNKDISILLTGETGTGKEAFARAIHNASQRADKPFVAVNCASIPENLIESELFGYKHGAFTGARREGMRGKIAQSSGGTLFLDEIGDMPLQLQTRLLRVLEEREVLPLGSDTPIPVDLHVVSATHCNLQQRVKSDQFREDLYYRLNGITLTMPPLRERADRPLLIRSVLAEESQNDPVHMSERAFAVLNDYAWPGNIRQLRNVLRTAAALCEDAVIRLENLPPEITRPNLREVDTPVTSVPPPQAEFREVGVDRTVDEGDTLARSERETLLRVLEQHRWHVTNASVSLGLSRNTLYRKMKKHGIKATAGA